MADPHLNLFYSYNHDNELIENNLTRAWIVTMRLLLAPARARLLAAVLGQAHRQSKAGPAPLSLEQAEFALQGHMDRGLCAGLPRRHVLAIASERYEEGEAAGARAETYASMPDAWIYDPTAWVYLVEAKVGANPVDDRQLRSHAREWLGLAKGELEAHLVSLSWFDVLAAIEALRAGEGAGAFDARDKALLAELVEYLGYFGYRLFKGFDWAALLDAPSFDVTLLRKRRVRLPGFARLANPPRFRIDAG